VAAGNGKSNGDGRLLRDPAKPVAFQPRPDGPTYQLKVPTTEDIGAYLEVTPSQWSETQIARSARHAVETTLAGAEHEEERTRLVAVLDGYLERFDEAFRLQQEGDQAAAEEAFSGLLDRPYEVEEIIERFRARDPQLRRRLGQNKAFPFQRGLVAARMFLVGWKGGSHLGEFRRDPFDGAPESVLRQIDPSDIVAIGTQVNRMMTPSEELIKNSDSDSSGEADQKSSEASTDAPPKSPSTSRGTASATRGSTAS
jgi:hypothetical protein